MQLLITVQFLIKLFIYKYFNRVFFGFQHNFVLESSSILHLMEQTNKSIKFLFYSRDNFHQLIQSIWFLLQFENKVSESITRKNEITKFGCGKIAHESEKFFDWEGVWIEYWFWTGLQHCVWY